MHEEDQLLGRRERGDEARVGQVSVDSRESDAEFVEEEEGLSQQMAPGEEVGGRAPCVLRAPQRVSQADREAHEATHAPFKAWCPYCVRGRARNYPHRRRGDERRDGVPRISLDYFYMSKADEAASENPLLVVIDESTGEKWARAVGQKGLGQEGELDWVVKDLSEELKAWGHAGGQAGHIILKTDGERSIVAVRDALARYHGGKVVVETPPRGESQSNGAVEEAGKIVREYVRVLREQLEHKAKTSIAGADAITQWMVRWSAMLCSRYVVGRDGLTPYERRRGRQCSIPVVPFGERVWYKQIRQQKSHKDKLDAEWHEGIWVGHARNSNEHLIGTVDGVIRAYAVKRQPSDRRWDGELAKNIRGTPQQPDPSRPGVAIPVRVNFEAVTVDIAPPVAEEEPERQIRRMRITATMLAQHGYTEGCEGCRFRRAGMGESRGHTEACRSRIEAAMAGSEAGKRILEEQRLRIERRRAEQVEQASEEKLPEPAPQEAPAASERAQNAGAGCSNPGARSECSPATTTDAHDLELSESHPSGSSGEQCGGMEDCGDGARKSNNPNAGQSSETRCRSRSRSPARRPQELDIGTPQRAVSAERPSSDGGSAVVVRENLAVKREAPQVENEPKRVRLEDEETGMDIDALSLRKLITVGPNTRVVGDAPPQEEEEVAWSGAWDDVSGEELDPAQVRAARQLEMDYVQKRGVWRKVPRSLAVRNGWNIIPTRWIDINKGDNQQPNYRSRLVAKEFNTCAQEGLFAATPPLEALRLLMSEAATEGAGDKAPKVVMLNDVARAFFEAPMRRMVCVELPAEALGENEAGADVVGFLELSLYGTRDAAANFQREVKEFMLRQGFVQSQYSPQVYYHPVHGLKTLVHGDDFVTVGERHQARWLDQRLRQRFEIKTVVIGRGPNEKAEHRVLGRIVRATDSAWEYEADPRHAELLIKALRLDAANGVKSPGEDDRPWMEEENGEHLQGADASEYRALAARANYLAQDRADILFAAKECCRGMAAPTRGHMRAIRRLARFLIAVPRVVWTFAPQARQKTLRFFSDSDWAGCRRTARSTSGGVAMLGTHCVKCYSVTQKFVTLSSGEAELMAMVKATTEAIGLTQLAASWGNQLEAEIFVDSSAALAVTNRKGCGKLRHVRIGHLWIQELSAEEAVKFSKVRGTENPADLMTKHLHAGARERLVPLLGQAPKPGHADCRLQLKSAVSQVTRALQTRAGKAIEGEPCGPWRIASSGHGGVFD